MGNFHTSAHEVRDFRLLERSILCKCWSLWCGFLLKFCSLDLLFVFFRKYFMARQNKIYSCFLITQNLSLFDYSLSAEYSNWPREFEMLLPVPRLKRLEFRLKLKPSYFILLSLLKGNLFASFTRWSRNKFPGATCSDKLKFPSCFIFLKASPRFCHFLIHAPFLSP